MSANTQILHLFLASPGDLIDERRAAKEVVIEVNQEVGRNLGWQIEVLGWEDTLPGFQRPQDIINRDVDRCDLFVGMLWKRWGQPTGNGQHSSGFEEEYMRATTRRTHSSLPEVWLFFKDIDVDTRNDPGPQAERVLRFREGIEQAKRPYFQTFPTMDGWRQVLRKRLIDFLFEQRKKPPEDQGADTGQSTIEISATRDEGVAESDDTKATASKEEALACLRSIASSVSMGALDAVSLSTIDAQAIARLVVVASTFFRKLDPEHLLSVREINTIYSFRLTTSPTDREKLHLLRSGLADSDGIVPLFYWQRGRTASQVAALFSTFAMYDGSERVRKGVLRLLEIVDAKLSPVRAKELFEACERKGGDALLVQALKFIGKFGDSSSLAQVRPYQESTNSFVRTAAAGSWIGILRRSGIGNFVNALVTENRALNLPRINLTDTELQSVPEGTWRMAAVHVDERVRQLAALALIAHGKVPEQLAADSLVETREIVVRAKIRMHLPIAESDILTAYEGDGGGSLLSGHITDKSDTLEQYYQTLSYDDLIAKLAWYETKSAGAYKVLAEQHFDRFGERVFVDLEEGFASFRSKSRKAMSHFSEEAIDRLYANLETYFFGLHAAAALSGAGTHRPVDALPYARRYLTRPDYGVGLAAARILSKVGTKDDILKVIEASKAWDIASADDVVEGIRKFFPKIDALIFDGSVPFHLRRRLIETADRADLFSDVDRLVKALANDDEGLRATLAKRVGVISGSKQIEDLIQRYMSQAYYYYNVVQILDAACYAPLSWRKSLAAGSSKFSAF